MGGSKFLSRNKSFLILIFIAISFSAFGQKKKIKNIPVDSLYAEDIREVQKIYPNLIIKEYVPKSKPPIETDSLTVRMIPIKYPQDARENDIQGTVYCRYVVDTLGNMKDIKIIKGLGGGGSQEIINVLTEFSKNLFKPLVVEGKKMVIYQKERFEFTLY